MKYVRHDLRAGTVRDLRFLDDDDDRSDEVRIEGDDPPRETDEEIDEPW
jgi:hypothetical protein